MSLSRSVSVNDCVTDFMMTEPGACVNLQSMSVTAHPHRTSGLRAVRLAFGVTQADLAERTGVHRSLVSRIERGLYHLSAECRRRYIAHRVEEARREMFEALRDVRREMMN